LTADRSKLYAIFDFLRIIADIFKRVYKIESRNSDEFSGANILLMLQIAGRIS
jgi:hypothetical protein